MNSSSPPRRPGRPRLVASILDSGNSRIRDIGRRAAYLCQVKSRLWPHLPADLRAHCDLANIREASLVIVARSPVWAAKLRHTSPEILHAAVNLCKINVSQLQVRVDPGHWSKSSAKRKRGVSEAVAKHLEAVADGVADSELKDQLQRIAKRRR